MSASEMYEKMKAKLGHVVPDVELRYKAELADEIMRLIVRKEVREFAVQLEEKGVNLEVTDKAVAWLADKGFSSLYGAREVARLFQDKVKNFFVDAVLFGELKGGGKATVRVKKDDIVIECSGGRATKTDS